MRLRSEDISSHSIKVRVHQFNLNGAFYQNIIASSKTLLHQADFDMAAVTVFFNEKTVLAPNRARLVAGETELLDYYPIAAASALLPVKQLGQGGNS